jgi:6-phosphogluconolactonase
MSGAVLRRSVALATAVVLAASLACCGGSSSQVGSSGDPPTGNSQLEVLYAAYYTPNGGGAGGFVLPLAINLGTGALTSRTSVLGPGDAFTIVSDPTRKFLYSSDFNTDLVFAYAIDSSSGNLTPVSGSPYSTPFSPAENGGPLAMDPLGSFLFFADASGNIFTFLINSDGTLTLSSAPAMQDTYQPLALIVDPSGKFLYASNHSDFSGGGQISVFSIDGTTGGLSPLPGSPFVFAQPNSEPWGLALSSDGNFLFTALSNVAQIAVLGVNNATGSVTPVPSSPFSAGASIPEQLVQSPSGKYLYVGNASVGSISAFSVDVNSGNLAMIHNPYSTVSYFALAIDPSGGYLFSSDRILSGQGIVWQIDPSSGGLSQIGGIPSLNGAPTAMTAIALP